MINSNFRIDYNLGFHIEKILDEIIYVFLFRFLSQLTGSLGDGDDNPVSPTDSTAQSQGEVQLKAVLINKYILLIRDW